MSNNFTVIVLALIVAAVLGTAITECGSYQREQMRYRSGDAYFNCIQTCSNGSAR